MQPWVYYLIASLLIAAFAAVLIVLMRQRQAQQALLQQRLSNVLSGEALAADAGWLDRLLHRFSSAASMELLDRERHADIQQLLRQAGLISPSLRNGFMVLANVAPAILAPLAWLLAIALGKSGFDLLTAPVIGAGLGYLVPRWLARALARRRQARIATEVPMMLQFLLMLFEAGLSVEQALRVIHRETKRLIPDLADELEVVLKRVNAGDSAADALAEVAAALEVPELIDSAGVLRQLLRHGGGARESLGNLIALFDDRRRTDVQERVSKISAKMSVVMMVFLFPALLVFLAGPGLLALLQALGGLAGG